MGGKGEERGGVSGEEKGSDGDGWIWGYRNIYFKTNKLFIPHCRSKQRGWKQGCGGVGEGDTIRVLRTGVVEFLLKKQEYKSRYLLV